LYIVIRSVKSWNYFLPHYLFLYLLLLFRYLRWFRAMPDIPVYL
jgi:hypothetical protein